MSTISRLLAASDDSFIDDFCTALKKKKYVITESDNLEDFLGVHTEEEDGCLHLS